MLRQLRTLKIKSLERRNLPDITTLKPKIYDRNIQLTGMFNYLDLNIDGKGSSPQPDEPHLSNGPFYG
jgi:hypothetical protein